MWAMPLPTTHSKGSMTGQIIFEMLDGTRIPARVGPDRDIISSNTFLARFVSLLYNNANLGRMIIGLAFFICIILAILCSGDTASTILAANAATRAWQTSL